MSKKYSGNSIQYIVGDVRDKQCLYKAINNNNIDIIIHAAALKHVPVCECNPREAIKTNILGSSNVIDVSIELGVKKVIALSTDKAVHPINVYGSTKLCLEKLFISSNNSIETKIAVVRYGNVVNSRGSVVPYFKSCNDNNMKIPVTDKRMTRFWITLNRAVDFVVRCLQCMRGGEIFVPKMPSLRIVDLASAISIRPIKEIGIRMGEKLHEELISKEESEYTLDFPGYYIITPNNSRLMDEWRDSGGIDIEKIGNEETMFYASNKNVDWLTIEQIKNSLTGGTQNDPRF